MTNEEKVIRFREIVNDMADLYEKKNKNYGNSFGELFEKLGPISGLVPLHNKLDRATNLVNGGVNNFESLEDTFKDLACYAVMNLIEMEATAKKEEGEKPLVEKFYDDYYKNLNSPLMTGNPNIGWGEPIKTTYKSTDPCEGCPTKEMLQTGGTYVGDLPCQWCSKNPYKFSCGTATTVTTSNDGTYTTHTLNDRKGERKTNG